MFTSYTLPKRQPYRCRCSGYAKYNDFWSYNVDIPNRNIDTSIYKGERYNFVEWRKVVLYPQRAGKLEIKPLSLDVTVNVPTGKRDFFSV
ncbi:MAG: hypothetical protein CM15mP83_7500 [Flavobacteriaceae bacterium]|nr:MAG: hypothetical protein CM15mP83_7500 [Flavobacteriaceae bacterium]